MAKRFSLQLELTGLGQAAQEQLPADADVARRLAECVEVDHRLGFARSFAYAVVRACWKTRAIQSALSPLPETLDVVSLSKPAIAEAERLGASIAKLEPITVAYIVGTVYTAALPEAHRSSHGIFYTPPELVERLLTMADEAGVN